MINSACHDSVHADIIALLNEAEQEELFKGAYFILQDNGLYYMKWASLPSSIRRQSSHHSVTDQFSIRGHSLSECLFSTRKFNGETSTWFQLERYSHAPSQAVPHALCYLYHVFTGENVGPRGTSLYTEANPYLIPKARVEYGKYIKL